MRIYADVLQGSDQWHALRLGIPTASNFHKVVTPKKCELSKVAIDYALRLCAEKLLNTSGEATITNQWLDRGKELEPVAVKQYEWQYEAATIPVGFITTDDGTIGCSPDRLVVSDRKIALEIKCPSPHVHLGYLLNGTDDDYRPQVMGQCYVAELDRAELFSYHPQMPPALIQNARDEEYIAKLADALKRFNENLFALFERAKALGFYQPVARATSPVETMEMADIAKMFQHESAMKMQREGFVA